MSGAKCQRGSAMVFCQSSVLKQRLEKLEFRIREELDSGFGSMTCESIYVETVTSVNIALTQVKSTHLLESANNCVRLGSQLLQAQVPN